MSSWFVQPCFPFSGPPPFQCVTPARPRACACVSEHVFGLPSVLSFLFAPLRSRPSSFSQSGVHGSSDGVFARALKNFPASFRKGLAETELDVPAMLRDCSRSTALELHGYVLDFKATMAAPSGATGTVDGTNCGSEADALCAEHSDGSRKQFHDASIVSLSFTDTDTCPPTQPLKSVEDIHSHIRTLQTQPRNARKERVWHIPPATQHTRPPPTVILSLSTIS